MSGISYRTTWGNIKWRPMNKPRRTLSLTKKKHAIASSINMIFEIFVHIFVMCFLAVIEAVRERLCFVLFEHWNKKKRQVGMKSILSVFTRYRKIYLIFTFVFFFTSLIFGCSTNMTFIRFSAYRNVLYF